MWQEFFTAIALVLVIEGILPFLSPDRFRKTLEMVSQIDDGAIRKMGLMTMLLGLVVLYLAR
jgi:hypothetical protein